MALEDIEGIQPYDEAIVNELATQGWVVAADGIPNDQVEEVVNSFTEETQVFQKEDGTCLILALAPQEGEEAPPEAAAGETPEGIREGQRERMDDVFGDLFPPEPASRKRPEDEGHRRAG